MDPARSPEAPEETAVPILAVGTWTDDYKPSQSIDFIERLAGMLSVDLGRSLHAWSDLLDGMSIALLSAEANQVNRTFPDEVQLSLERADIWGTQISDLGHPPIFTVIVLT